MVPPAGGHRDGKCTDGEVLNPLGVGLRGDGPGGPGTVMTIVRNHWVADTKKLQISGRLAGLRVTAQHLVGHIREANVDDETLVEMHEHMAHMDQQLDSFHAHVEHAAAKWRRSRPNTMPDTQVGDVVPLSLVVPVLTDCFLDGFLIGIACCLTPAAGIILGVANCLEMSFLGTGLGLFFVLRLYTSLFILRLLVCVGMYMHLLFTRCSAVCKIFPTCFVAIVLRRPQAWPTPLV